MRESKLCGPVKRLPQRSHVVSGMDWLYLIRLFVKKEASGKSMSSS